MPKETIDESIIRTIQEVRAIHHCCTAGEVARQLTISKSYVIQRCAVMKERGIIDWTTMPGSLHLMGSDAEVEVEGGGVVSAPSTLPVLPQLEELAPDDLSALAKLAEFAATTHLLGAGDVTIVNAEGVDITEAVATTEAEAEASPPTPARRSHHKAVPRASQKSSARPVGRP